MSGSKNDKTYPSGRPPWDTWNGLRIGSLAGGILGVIATITIGLGSFWLVLPGAVIGGAMGYWSQRRKRQ